MTTRRPSGGGHPGPVPAPPCAVEQGRGSDPDRALRRAFENYALRTRAVAA